MKLTKEQIEKASKIAVRNEREMVKTFDGQKLGRWKAYWDSIIFTPSLKREDGREYLKKVKEKK